MALASAESARCAYVASVLDVCQGGIRLRAEPGMSYVFEVERDPTVFPARAALPVKEQISACN